MHDKLISKLLEAGDINALNRLVATRSVDKNAIIDEYKEIIPDLYITYSTIHGKGVFTRSSINSGQLIESVHIIPLEFTSKYHKDTTIMNYCYALPKIDTETLDKEGHQLFIFTGFGMMYNHRDSNRCNAKWLWDLDHQSAKLIAKKKISPNEEITIDYGYGYWNRK